MAPLTLILLGIVLYFVNQRPDTHFGLRGLPWVDVPSLCVILGGVLFIAKDIIKRRALKSAQALKARREALACQLTLPSPSEQSPPPDEQRPT